MVNEKIHEEEIGYNTPGKESVRRGIFIFILTCNIFSYHYCNYYYYVTITKFCMEQNCFIWCPLFEWKAPFGFVYISTKSNVMAQPLMKQSIF